MIAAQTRGITTIPSISLNTTHLYLPLQRYILSHLITQSLHTILRGTPPRACSRHHLSRHPATLAQDISLRPRHGW
ncbi:uncharacterized protein SCHCODRAFT_02630162 [Schizophyllum commune H4-8]|uniref:uncharacterized protein n=1 Tax=Schizophyllum commune (strain H4-8 / FGSC 9210) TaxID=578458 RepID=UPI00215EB37A|nr:uncharacterized protein SCHCODRAFT_02630162 [Schizophyllum commune H4-8]KAI5891836.1 hypothetical protein SCHCODRAFT_02630162 [Schizophyllum commune H4-8]